MSKGLVIEKFFGRGVSNWYYNGWEGAAVGEMKCIKQTVPRTKPLSRVSTCKRCRTGRVRVWRKMVRRNRSSARGDSFVCYCNWIRVWVIMTNRKGLSIVLILHRTSFTNQIPAPVGNKRPIDTHSESRLCHFWYFQEDEAFKEGSPDAGSSDSCYLFVLNWTES